MPRKRKYVHIHWIEIPDLNYGDYIQRESVAYNQWKGSSKFFDSEIHELPEMFTKLDREDMYYFPLVF
jgi:hypothetical protein